MINFKKFDKGVFIDDLCGELDLLDELENDVDNCEGSNFEDKINNCPEWLKVLYVFHDFVSGVGGGGLGFIFINMVKPDLDLLVDVLTIIGATKTLTVIENGIKIRETIYRELNKEDLNNNLALEFKNAPPFDRLLELDNDFDFLSNEFLSCGFNYLKENVIDKYIK